MRSREIPIFARVKTLFLALIRILGGPIPAGFVFGRWGRHDLLVQPRGPGTRPGAARHFVSLGDDSMAEGEAGGCEWRATG